MELPHSQERHIPLLRDTIELLLVGAEYFVGHTPRARKARKRLEKRDPDDGAFFASLFADLKQLAGTLASTSDIWTGDQDTNKNIQAILDVVQDGYLKQDAIYEDEEEEEYSRGEAEKDPYLVLKLLLKHLKHEEGPEECDKIPWLCERVKFEQTKPQSREALLSAISICHGALKLSNCSSDVDISWRPFDPATTLWTTSLFSKAEDFHDAMSNSWRCSCFEAGSHYQLHQRATFSFESIDEPGHDITCGAMLFPTEQHGSKVWKFTRFQYEHDDGSLKAPRGHLPVTSIVGEDRLCDMLDAVDRRRFIKIAGRVSKLEDRPTNTGDNALDTILGDQMPLTPWVDLGSEHVVYGMTSKRRMMLALFLVYAYLNLGGGSWWPYNRKASILFANSKEPDGSVTIFFAASLVKDDISTNREDMVKEALPLACNANRAMPSLIALGRLLLSLYVGHYISWDDVESELRKIPEEPFAFEISEAVNTCLYLDDAVSSTGTRTIRDNMDLHSRFVRSVVLPIQTILHHGYKVRAQDVFAAPAQPKIHEITSLKRMRSPIPLVVERPQDVPDGFCLHDGGDKQAIKGNDDHTADSYMERLKTCVYKTLSRLPSAPTGRKGHVKIAILDTGADICQDQLENLYDGRIRENKTWLNSSKEDGEYLIDADGRRPLSLSLDHNGHGTHGTSVLLEATEGTSVEVYVAQVFKAAREKQTEGQIVDDQTTARIARAMRHAVDVWKVDVISMSFGYSKAVPEIDKVVDYASSQDVLMLAAASNCGGNHPCSWPARDERVLCMYASDGDGNKYSRNPDPMPGQDNFATLGCAVKALWPAASRDDPAPRVRRSGTSTAAPIAAVIAALVISSMRQCEDQYINACSKSALVKETLRETYRDKIRYLGRAARMRKVFRLMLGAVGHRDGYQYITPWTLFRDDMTAEALAEKILFDD